MAKAIATKYDELETMVNMSAEKLIAEEDDKRMTEAELDQVAGGYSYGMMQRIVGKNGQVTYKMYNQDTGKIESHTGEDEKAALTKLIQHNYDNYQKTIILHDPKGNATTFDVDALADELGLKRRK